jgi:hypothetical protein
VLYSTPLPKALGVSMLIHFVAAVVLLFSQAAVAEYDPFASESFSAADFDHVQLNDVRYIDQNGLKDVISTIAAGSPDGSVKLESFLDTFGHWQLSRQRAYLREGNSSWSTLDIAGSPDPQIAQVISWILSERRMMKAQEYDGTIYIVGILEQDGNWSEIWRAP